MKTKLHDDIGIIVLKKKMMSIKEATELYEDVTYFLSNNVKNIILDLKDVAWMNSVGVGSVMRCYTSVKNNNGKLLLARLTEKTSHVFMITQLFSIFKFYDSVEEAIEELKVTD